MNAALPITVLMVTHNSASDLRGAFGALVRLDPLPAELVVVDCASADSSAAFAREHAPSGIPTRVEALADNRGFAGGMNRAIELAQSPFLLTLNADAEPRADFLPPLFERLDGVANERVAAVTGRLLRPAVASAARKLDACGMRLTRSWRHLDRGSGEVDRGQYESAEFVFGATGAATLFRRAALDDVAVGSQIFDERFHSFREDAELAFRFHERGWRVIYEPRAVAVHRRSVLPERRSTLPAAVNYHSLKNRYLLRLDHQSATNFFATLAWTLPRDLAALVYVAVRERSSWRAYTWLWRHRRALGAHRREVRSRITAPAGAVERWFRSEGEPV